MLTSETNAREAFEKLSKIEAKMEEASIGDHNPRKHADHARLTITKTFLYAYFFLIAGGFLFCFLYNWFCAYVLFHWKVEMKSVELGRLFLLLQRRLEAVLDSSLAITSKKNLLRVSEIGKRNEKIIYHIICFALLCCK